MFLASYLKGEIVKGAIIGIVLGCLAAFALIQILGIK